MKKGIAIKYFVDKDTKQKVLPNSEVQYPEERFNFLVSKGYVTELKEDKQPKSTKEDKTKKETKSAV